MSTDLKGLNIVVATVIEIGDTTLILGRAELPSYDARLLGVAKDFPVVVPVKRETSRESIRNSSLKEGDTIYVTGEVVRTKDFFVQNFKRMYVVRRHFSFV